MQHEFFFHRTQYVWLPIPPLLPQRNCFCSCEGLHVADQRIELLAHIPLETNCIGNADAFAQCPATKYTRKTFPQNRDCMIICLVRSRLGLVTGSVFASIIRPRRVQPGPTSWDVAASQPATQTSSRPASQLVSQHMSMPENWPPSIDTRCVHPGHPSSIQPRFLDLANLREHEVGGSGGSLTVIDQYFHR